MIDILLKSYWVEKKVYYAFILGFFFAMIGMGFANIIFSSEPSFPAIFLTTLAAAPVVIRLITSEEWEPKFEKIFSRHGKVIETYAYLFFGMATAFALVYALAPQTFVDSLFAEQSKKFVFGYFVEPSSTFYAIFINNLGLVFFFFLLSLFYGSGSIFLLAWNASILGVLWGNILKIALTLSSVRTLLIGTIFPLPYLIPEVLAYFLAAVAGGMVAINLTKKEKIAIAMVDSLIFLFIAIFIIIGAAFIETYMLNNLAQS